MKQPQRYRPQGQMTRGKTARNRLRRSDIFMLLTEGPLIRMQDEPGKPMGVSITAHVLNPDSPSGIKFLEWLKRLYS